MSRKANNLARAIREIQLKIRQTGEGRVGAAERRVWPLEALFHIAGFLESPLNDFIFSRRDNDGADNVARDWHTIRAGSVFDDFLM
eukprot:scaffold248444_cov71-Cyclotella_meneghiniana.AAC.6